jgi:hypothetical protein
MLIVLLKCFLVIKAKPDKKNETTQKSKIELITVVQTSLLVLDRVRAAGLPNRGIKRQLNNSPPILVFGPLTVRIAIEDWLNH